ncbi:hypothetical protein KW787_01390 [Candidatus Pacearchaeota archaeon]|nr:hypothetical protein [Candidatus Pacearchaeota archaeon]
MKFPSKTEAKTEIYSFFQKQSFNSDELKKIKRLAMKYNIKLGPYKKSFCKKCMTQLRGQIRIDKHYKMVVCANCGYQNKVIINR